MDNLTTLKGVGKATAAMLAAAGVSSFAELASADAAELTAKGDFKPSHDVAAWIAEAKSIVTNGGVKPKGWRGAPVSIVLKADVDGVGVNGDTVTLPKDDADALRHAGKARRLLLTDLKSR